MTAIDGPRENGEGTPRDLRGDPALLQDLRRQGPRPPGAYSRVRPRFARENPVGKEVEGMQATLEELAEKSRDERERFERLARKSSEAYMKVLKGPADEHHHKTEEAKADLEEASPS